MAKKPDATVADDDGPDDETPPAANADQEQVDETETDGDEPEEEVETPDDASEPEEGTEQPDVTPARGKPQSRGDRRFQQMNDRVLAAEREAAEARARLEERDRQTQGRQTQEEQERERERISLLPLEDQVRILREQDRKEVDQRLGAIEFRSVDAADKLAFERLVDRMPALAPFAEQTEAALAQMRRNGGNQAREWIAKALLGDSITKRAATNKTRQANRGAENITRARVQPAQSGSDAGRTARGADDSEAALERRLMGKKF